MQWVENPVGVAEVVGTYPTKDCFPISLWPSNMLEEICTEPSKATRFVYQSSQVLIFRIFTRNQVWFIYTFHNYCSAGVLMIAYSHSCQMIQKTKMFSH